MTMKTYDPKQENGLTEALAIRSNRWDDRECVLCYRSSGGLVLLHDQVTYRDGPERLVTGGRAPHKESSSGRVYTKLQEGGYADSSDSSEAFPPVYDMEWRLTE